MNKNELIAKLGKALQIKYDSLPKNIIRSSLHIYSVLGQTRYATYAIEVKKIMSQYSVKKILDWRAMYGHMSFLLRVLNLEVVSVDIDHKGEKEDYTEESVCLILPRKLGQ